MSNLFLLNVGNKKHKAAWRLTPRADPVAAPEESWCERKLPREYSLLLVASIRTQCCEASSQQLFRRGVRLHAQYCPPQFLYSICLIHYVQSFVFVGLQPRAQSCVLSCFPMNCLSECHVSDLTLRSSVSVPFK